MIESSELVSWEVVQSVGHQALSLTILVRVQASQPILTASPRKREIQQEWFRERIVPSFTNKASDAFNLALLP